MKARKIDLIEVLIKNSHTLKVKKYGNSYYIHVPSELARELGLKPECRVRIAILEVLEPVEKDIEKVESDVERIE